MSLSVTFKVSDKMNPSSVRAAVQLSPPAANDVVKASRGQAMLFMRSLTDPLMSQYSFKQASQEFAIGL
jgi:hypothetical protein